jgi:flagellar motility protein MotE (MotC chaperone)
MYEAMKPKVAGSLFDRMDPVFAAGFLSRMRPEAGAAVIGSMQPERAYAVSVILASRNLELENGRPVAGDSASGSIERSTASPQ